ncbi:MAG TPA: nitrile hydratase subunit alpha [bacterium]|nr:nitrile hydratase subunit alpha [bacterium]
MSEHHDHAEGHEHRGYGVPFEVVETAMRELLQTKGIITAAELAQSIVDEDARTPENGARFVARFWSDPAFAGRARADAKAAAAELGFDLTVAPGLELLENTDAVRHVTVCTLCSCSPTFLIGPPPAWYKGTTYRKRIVRDPRAVVAEWGTHVPDSTELRVVDTTTETRYLVIPQRPAGTDGWSEERLARLVTRDSLFGVEDPLDPTTLAE